MEKVNEYFQKAMEARAALNKEESVKNLQLALKRLAKFEKAEPKNPAYPFRRAQIYLALKANKYAESDLLKTISRDPQNPLPVFLLGNVYLDTKEFNMAVQAYDKFFVINEQNPCEQNLAEVYYRRAIARNGVCWYAEALKDLDKVAELNPDYPSLEASRTAIQNNKFDNDLSEYNESIQHNPKDWRTLTERGHCYAGYEKYDLAIADYKASLDIKPNNVDAWVKLGISYCKDHQYQLALDSFEQAKKIDSFHEKELVTEFKAVAEKALKA